MYRNRIENTAVSGEHALALKRVLLDYHDFQKQTAPGTLEIQLKALTVWQSERLRDTHADLYQTETFRAGLDFLFDELYGARDFSARDRDLERIFPKLVKWLPDKILATVSTLVELNLLTQRLDKQLAETLLQNVNGQRTDNVITTQNYVEAYACCQNKAAREKQLQLTQAAGALLEKHAGSAIIRYSLKLAQAPAEKAGLKALHAFLVRGFDAFHNMRDIDILIPSLIDRESAIMVNMFNREPKPFYWPESESRSTL
jgi:hypothetical protein